MTLKRLEGSDYHVADESVDIRGWKVEDQSGVDVGMIDTLLFDPDKGHVVYAVLDIEGARRVLVPISMVAIDEHRRRVVAGKYDRARLMAMPAYEGGHLGEDVELAHYGEHVPNHRRDVPPDYTGAPFRHEVPDRIRRLESGMGTGAPSSRALTFSGTEPSASELAERDRLIEEDPPNPQPRGFY